LTKEEWQGGWSIRELHKQKKGHEKKNIPSQMGLTNAHYEL